jgi:hypothetical protein
MHPTNFGGFMDIGAYSREDGIQYK